MTLARCWAAGRYLSALRRTRIGPIDVEVARPRRSGRAGPNASLPDRKAVLEKAST
jgi:hypothetical protein